MLTREQEEGGGQYQGQRMGVIEACQRGAEARGEIAVPVAARVEAWLLAKQSQSQSHSRLALTATALQTAPHLASEQQVKEQGQLPTVGSKAWEENEAAMRKVLLRYGGTGVLDAISAAVSLRPPVRVYPVSDLDSEAPVAWTSSMGGGAGAGTVLVLLYCCVITMFAHS